MALYVSGRQPSLSVGIPGISTNSPVLDITGRIGIGTTNPSADIDLNTIRIRQSIIDASNSSGQLGYFLTNDASGIRWTAVPPDYNNALFVFQNGVISGFSSYTGLNFTSDGNDLVAISTNINPNIVDIKINSYWNKDGNTGIYTSKFVGIGSTNPSVALDVIGDVKISGISTLGTVKISSGIVTATSGVVTYYGDGSKLTGVSGVRVEFQDLVGDPVYPTLANNAGVSSVGIATTGTNALVFIPNSGSLGIGTTNPTSKLWVNGDGYFVGVVTFKGLYVNGELIGQEGITGTNLVGTALSISGISTFNSVKISSGIVTSNIVGVSVTFYGDFVGTASTAGYATTAFNLDTNAASRLNVSYAQTAGIATNLKGSVIYSLPYQSGINTTSFLSPGDSGYYLKSNGPSLAPSWEQIPNSTINVVETASTLVNFPLFVSSSGNTSTLSFNTSLFSFIPQSNNPRLGIGTGSPAYTLDVNGKGRFIGTLGADIYYGNGFVGSALSISGISTLGTVKISSGIVTATSGVVTYYGDGSKLTGVSGVRVEFQDLVGDPVYPTLANNAGVSSIGIVTSGTNALVFIPNSGSLGIGTTVPTEKLQVNGNISINGTTSYGSTTETTTTTSQIGIHSGLSTSTYRSVEYTIQATQGTNYHATKILSIHDGTITYNSEYGTIYNNGLVGTFDVDISGGNMRLLVTPTSSSLTKYTINFITTKI